MATLEAFDFILFGGNGDLAMRKLLPALYYRHRDSGAAGELSIELDVDPDGTRDPGLVMHDARP